MTNLAEHQLAPTYSRPSIHIISDIYDIYQVMDGYINLRRLAALMRSCVKQATPARYFDGGYQRIRRYGRTNGRTFDLPSESVGGRIIEVSGQRGGKFSSRARHISKNIFRCLPDHGGQFD